MGFILNDRNATLRGSPLAIAEIMRSVNKRLINGTPYELVLEYVFHSMAEAVPYDRLGIALLEDDDRVVTLKWMKSSLAHDNLPVGYTGAIKGSSLEQIMRTGRPRIINDLRTYCEQRPQSESTKKALADGVRSSLTFPLKANGRAVGFVFFSSGLPNTYDENHAARLSQVADELSLLVEYGRLSRFFDAHKQYKQNLRVTVHDLRAPLSTLQGFVQLGHEQAWNCSIDQKAHDFDEILLRNIRFMFDLIADLSTSDAPCLSHSSGTGRRTNLAEFFEDFRLAAALLTARKSMNFVLLIRDSVPPTWLFESSTIRQVLDNLLANAIKFSHPATTVTLTVGCEPAGLVFRMSDQGQGIPTDELPLLFHEFGKTSVRPTAGEASTGLGLFISKRIVETYGGGFAVESQVGVGSTFTFWLPTEPATPLH